MKAFLSHSSKDKYYVSKVADDLGILQVELDEKTFNFGLNVQEIRKALQRCDLFVFFLSKDSVASAFVEEEHRSALEARGAGRLRRVLIFSIDGTSYRALPDWLREINVVQLIVSPQACARHIQAALIELAAEEGSSLGVYLGRDEEESDLRRMLAKPPAETPIFIHVVGHHGIGRRTFIKNTLERAFPRVYKYGTEVTLSNYEGAEELFRHLYSLHRVSSREETIDMFSRFSLMAEGEKIIMIADIIAEMSQAGEYVVILDEGGVYTEDGKYQKFLSALVKKLEHLRRPALMFAQTRMMPVRNQLLEPRSYHRYLGPLSDQNIMEILSFLLKEMELDFSEVQLQDVGKLLDGHPYNVRFAIQFILNYGLDNFLDDPSDLIEWKNKRAVDFLAGIEFGVVEGDIMAVLSEYQYLSSAALIGALDSEKSDIATAVRVLQEYCCIERRETYFYIASPIRDGVRRDRRFVRTDSWKQEVGWRICDMVSAYTSEDRFPVEIIQTATLAAAKSKNPPSYLSNLILPSHLLRLAREMYDAGKRVLCVELCGRVFEMRERLPEDAHVEILRLWGLSAVRGGNTLLFGDVLAKLRVYKTPVAKRTNFFLEGFDARLRGNLDLAEEKFLSAWKMSRNNQSFNRELASLYCKQRRFDSAEMHARKAYESAPTNPYLIDIFAETLLGKQSLGLNVDENEIDTVLGLLRIYGDAPGSSFYLVRESQRKLKQKKMPEALELIKKAIDRTPNLLSPYFIRSEIFLAISDLSGVDSDLKQIERLLSDAGGFSEGDEARLQELKIRLHIQRGQLSQAIDSTTKGAFLSAAVKRRLLNQIAEAAKAFPNSTQPDVLHWAKTRAPNSLPDEVHSMGRFNRGAGKGRGKSQN